MNAIFEYAKQKKMSAFLALGGFTLTTMLDLHIGSSGFVQETIISFGTLAASNLFTDVISPITGKNVLAPELKAYQNIQDETLRKNVGLGAMMGLVALCSNHLVPNAIEFTNTIHNLISAGMWSGIGVSMSSFGAAVQQRRIKAKEDVSINTLVDQQNDIIDISVLGEKIKNPLAIIKMAYKIHKIKNIMNLREAFINDSDDGEKANLKDILKLALKEASALKSIEKLFDNDGYSIQRAIHQRINYLMNYPEFVKYYTEDKLDEAFMVIQNYKNDYATQKNSLGYKLMTELELLTYARQYNEANEEDKISIQKNIEISQKTLEECLGNKNIGLGNGFNRAATRELLPDEFEYDSTFISLAFSYHLLGNNEKAKEYFDRQTSIYPMEQILENAYGYSDGYCELEWLYIPLNKKGQYDQFVEHMAQLLKIDLDQTTELDYETVVYLEPKNEANLKDKINQNRDIAKTESTENNKLDI